MNSVIHLQALTTETSEVDGIGSPMSLVSLFACEYPFP